MHVVRAHPVRGSEISMVRRQRPALAVGLRNWLQKGKLGQEVKETLCKRWPMWWRLVDADLAVVEGDSFEGDLE